MKKLQIFSLLVIMGTVGILTFQGCEKSTLMKFDARNSIYFPYTSSAQINMFYFGVRDAKGVFKRNEFTFTPVDSAAMDTLYTNFGYFSDTATAMCIWVNVNALGDTMGTDRPFKLEVESTSTLNPEFYYIDPATCVMPHGKLRTDVLLYINKAEALKAGVTYLSFHLAPNEHFNTDYKYEIVGQNRDRQKSTLDRTYSINNNLPRPSWWGPGNSIGAYAFEAFSAEKMRFLLNDMNVPLGFLLSNQPDLATLMGITEKYNCMIAEAKKAGHPIMDIDDETGEEFEMKPGSWGGNKCE